MTDDCELPTTKEDPDALFVSGIDPKLKLKFKLLCTEEQVSMSSVLVRLVRMVVDRKIGFDQLK